MKNNSDLLYELLRRLNIKRTDYFSNKLYEEHPHKDNLFGLSRMLKDYRIENDAYNFDNKDILDELEVPFVVQYNNLLVIVLRITKTDVTYFWEGKELSVPIGEFKEKWSGVTLLINDYEKAIEPEYKENKLKETYSRILKFIVVSAVFLIPLLIILSNTGYGKAGIISLLVLNSIGAYIGYLLILKQIKIYSASADKICSIFKKSDCNNVLESKAAKLWGIIGWSEAGLSYFSSNLIIILIFPNLIPYLALINLFVLPYSIWSIWYQKVKAKQWCALCVIVQILFYLIFANNLIFGFIQMPIFSIVDIIIVGLVYVLPFCLVSLLIPIIAKSGLVGNLKHQFNKLKMTDEVFGGLLYANNHYEFEDASQIVFGSPDARMQVTVISNPHCQPCGSAHEKLDSLLDYMGDDICLRFMFINFDLDPFKDSGKFLIAAYLNNDSETARNIYYKWFTEEKYKVHKTYEKYGFDINSKEVLREQNKHEKWSKKNEVFSTPTILINGYVLPEIYNIDDLRFL